MKNIFAQLKNKTVQRVLIVIVLLVILVGGFLYFEKSHGRIEIENSLISAPIISVSPTTAGKLLETDVYEGEMIKRGDVLAVLDSQTLRADTDGLIVMANNQIGSFASSQTPVVQLINTHDMRVAGTIDENKGLKDIKVGQVVSFTVDALSGQTFWGYVDEVAPTAKQTQLSFSISSERPTQQFIVYARFDADTYPQIKNGMSAKMTIFTNTQ